MELCKQVAEVVCKAESQDATDHCVETWLMSSEPKRLVDVLMLAYVYNGGITLLCDEADAGEDANVAVHVNNTWPTYAKLALQNSCLQDSETSTELTLNENTLDRGLHETSSTSAASHILADSEIDFAAEIEALILNE